MFMNQLCRYYSKSKVKRSLPQKINNILENTYCNQRFLRVISKNDYTPRFGFVIDKLLIIDIPDIYIIIYIHTYILYILIITKN